MIGPIFLRNSPARLLNLLSPADRKETLQLLGFPEQNVGRLMTPDYVAVRPEWTIGQALEHIRVRGKNSETINVICVVDPSWKLIDALDLAPVCPGARGAKCRANHVQRGLFVKTIVTMTLNPAIDKSSSVAHVVAERKLYCNPPRFEPGGGGVNVCRAIKKLGGESMLLYPAGGLTGERLQDFLNQEGLDHRPFSIEGLNRESLVVLEESTGRQYRFGMPGPELQKKEWEQFLQKPAAMDPSPDYVVVSGSLPMWPMPFGTARTR